MDEIASKLANFIAKTYLKDESRTLAPDEPLLSSGIIDSFGLVDLTLFIENEFGVVLDPTELGADRSDTIAQFVALIRERQ